MIQSVRRIIDQHWPIILLILVNLIIGVAVARDYGQSWDEPGIQKYGGLALSAYVKFIKGESPPVYEIDLMYYGPAFGMFGALVVRALESSVPGWTLADYWHLVYFLSYQVAVISLYLLSRRWVDRWAALGVALLFTTQPLLWGHAFINPKDIPFMAFFLLSITLGFKMVDQGDVAPLPLDDLPQSTMSMKELSWEWGKSGLARKSITIIALALWFSVGVFILFFKGVVKGIVASMVVSAYDAQGFLGSLFARFAPNAGDVPVESYVNKAQSLLVRWEGFLFVLSGIALALILLRLIAPVGYRRFTDGILRPGLKACFFFLKKPFVYWAAIVLGLTISIRVLGPYAGILVALFAIWKMSKRSPLMLIPYFALAMLVSYLTWPFLWRDPVGRFLESVQVMSRFVQQEVGSLPGNSSAFSWLNIPKLASIQLTESLLIVVLAGLLVALFNLKNRKYLEPFLLWILWFLVPLIWMIVSNSTLYDNFRQMFFILPPLFIVGGLALDGLFAFFHRKWLNAAVIALLALPGIYACVQLHPYEYIYYNSLVGGVKGAFRHYELDYWATSYKEAAEYLNKVAPLNAAIGIIGTDVIFKPYSRPDLQVSYFNGVDVGEGFDYVVLTSRANNDLAVCPRAKVIKNIERDGAVLTAIKQVSSPEECVLSP